MGSKLEAAVGSEHSKYLFTTYAYRLEHVLLLFDEKEKIQTEDPSFFVNSR